MPSASKQKRLAEKAAKASSKGDTPVNGSAKITPSTSVNGGSTPMSNMSANASEEALADAQEEMRKLNMAQDRSAVGFLSASNVPQKVDHEFSPECWCLILKEETSRLISTR